MARLTVGQRMPEFSFNTPFETGRALSETVARCGGRTAIVFLRYYGCPLCQYDMHWYAEGYSSITENGGQLLVVLQSDPAKLAAQMNKGDLPYDIICDPDQRLYHEFEIKPAMSTLKMADIGMVAKLAKATAAGYKHGDYEGEELQLPAAFVVEKNLTLTYVHYGKSVSDVPRVQELAKLVARS